MIEPTLEVFSGETVVFASAGRWLHPLLALEEFLRGADHDVAALRARDRIVGKAAALLMIRLGLRTIEAGIMSRLAVQVLSAHGARYRYDLLVDRIDCQTEQILAEIDDPDEAHRIVLERAGRDGASPRVLSRPAVGVGPSAQSDSPDVARSRSR